MDEQQRRYSFFLSTFSRCYGVDGLTESMKKFSKYMAESDFKIDSIPLEEFDSIIINKFKYHD